MHVGVGAATVDRMVQKEESTDVVLEQRPKGMEEAERAMQQSGKSTGSENVLLRHHLDRCFKKVIIQQNGVREFKPSRGIERITLSYLETICFLKRRNL